MKTKNIVICLWSFFIPLSVFAQPDQIPVSIIKSHNKEQVKNYFNSDSVRIFWARFFNPQLEESLTKGLFFMYEKADTLNFSDPFYKTDTPFNDMGSTSMDYILEGLAYYEKKGNVYQKQFANDNAFFCSSCENMGYHNIKVNHDTATLSISWGPRFEREDEYVFVYRPKIRRWQIITGSSTGSFYGDYNNLYAEYTEKENVFLDNISTDGFLYYERNIAHRVELRYTAGNYFELLKELKKIPKQDYRLINKVFTTNNAVVFTKYNQGNDNITSKNVVAANNLGYFLEQANVLSPAAIILDSVIAKFPGRAVAYLNLADVYRKMGKSNKAINNYETYIKLMQQKNKENKIPKRVKAFVEENKK